MFGRKSPVLDVIKYEGPQDVFVWKHPREDFNSKSQLVVHESQQAIFFRNGQALDTLPAGRYTMDTQNLPLLRRMIGLVTGGESPFHCEVYFINKAVSMGMQWGTDSPIEMVDVEYQLPIRLTSYGDFSLQVADGRKLLIKLVGTVSSYTHEDIQKYFSSLVGMHVRDSMTNIMTKKNIGGMHINTQLKVLSAGIRKSLAEAFADYGLDLHHFIVSSVRVSGLEDLNDVMKKVRLDTIAESGRAGIERMRFGVDAERIQVTGVAENAVMLEKGKAENEVMLERGMAEAKVNRAKGITQVEKEAFSVARELAGNKGSNLTVVSDNHLIGGSGSSGDPGRPMAHPPAANASEIVQTIIGSGQENERRKRRERLEELKEWFEDELITQEEYESKRREILSGL